MARKRTLFQHQLLTVLIPVVAEIALAPVVANGQIVPDDSLGAESSTVRQNVIKDLDSDVIEGGAARGANLFHSFEEFNVGEGRGAYFANPDAIDNILSRVTGSNISEILGTLGVLGDANLFLLNPNGIVFGANARLDLNGSFFASTADSLLFENGFEFSASNPQAPPLLTVNIPIGLGFRDNPGSIVNQSAKLGSAGDIVGLEIQPGNDITFIGGSITFDGGSITAPGGRVELGGLAEAGIVGLNEDGSLSFPNDIKRADISLYGSEIDVVGSDGGSISIYADDLTLSTTKRIIGNAPQPGETYILQVSLEDGKLNEDGILGEQEPNNSPETAQNIDGFFSLSPNPDISDDTKYPHVSISATGDGTLDYYSFTVKNPGSWGIFDIDYGDTGEAGSINTELFLFDNQGNLIADNDDFGTLGGAGGSVSDLDPLISVFGFDTPGTYIIGVGKYNSRATSNLNAGIGSGLGSIDVQAGDITIDATGTVAITAESTIFNNVQSGAIGNSGNINIQAESLFIDNALVDSKTLGQGNAGNISVKVQESVNLNAVGLSSRVEDDAVGYGGNVEIQGQSLYMSHSSIYTEVDANGYDAGNIFIEVDDQIELDQAYILGRSFSEVTGDSGNINLKARSLLMSDQALISSSTFGRGNAGNISVEMSELVSLSNSTIRSDVDESDTVGYGGNINILTPSLFMSDESELSVSSRGQGDAGNITVQATETISLIDSEIISLVKPDRFVRDLIARGNGGDITLETRSLSLKDGAAIDSSNSGQGNAGKININATKTLNLRDESQISVSTLGQGNAGELNINAPSGAVSLNRDSVISAAVGSSATGDGGRVTIDSETLNLTNGGQIFATTFGKGDAGDVIITTNDLNIKETDNANNRFLTGIFANVRSLDEVQGGNVNITAKESIVIDGANSSISTEVYSGAVGDGGNVTLNTSNLSLLNSGTITVSTSGQGNAGKININVSDTVIIEGIDIDGNSSVISSQLGVEATGSAGNVTLNANTLNLRDGGQISVSTFGQGNAGDVNINVPNGIVSVDGKGSRGEGSKISSEIGFSAIGNGGNIILDTEILNLTNGGQISASTFGQGNAGDLNINAPDGKVSVDGMDSEIIAEVGSSAIGDGGNITLNAGAVNLTNDGAISTTTSGQGNAGELTIQAQDSVNLTNGGSLSTSALSFLNASGNNLTINTKNLNLRDGFINTASVGQGNAGSLSITATDSVNLDNASQIGTEALGQSSSGDLFINTGNLKIQGNSFITTLAVGQGNAGELVLEAKDSVYLIDGGGVSTNALGKGTGGELFINTGNLTLQNGAVSTSTTDAETFKQNFVNITGLEPIAIDFLFSILDNAAEADLDQGNSGNLTIQAREEVNILNRGFISTSSRGKVSGGSLSLTTPSLLLEDGSLISASTFGEGDAGNMQIESNTISLYNQSSITSETAAGNGGDIALQVEDILQLWDSQISTTAGNAQAGGDGGNMNIDANFIILDASNITASAFEGTGGKINITTQGLFQRNSDITASSQLGVDGVVQTNTPEIDPSQGLVELPENVQDPNKLIAQNACKRGTGSSLIVTGRGGLPPSSSQNFNSNWVDVDLIQPILPEEKSPSASNQEPNSTSSSEASSQNQFIPAEGWVVNEKGEIFLVAYKSSNANNYRQNNRDQCQPR